MIAQTETVQVGSWVRLHDNDGEDDDISLVLPEHADPFKGLVSAAAPLGKALLGRSVGDRVSVRAPGGVRVVTIMAVASAS
ncbi:MAG TPA: GreA/GreB family elongation factor [Candidatus Dormibacteraeota bacterium]|jgi:transcription elongation factor GreA